MQSQLSALSSQRTRRKPAFLPLGHLGNNLYTKQKQAFADLRTDLYIYIVRQNYTADIARHSFWCGDRTHKTVAVSDRVDCLFLQPEAETDRRTKHDDEQ